MNEKMAVVCGSIGAVGAAIAKHFGGWDNAVLALLIFMAVDFATGLACAIFWNKSNKSENGTKTGYQIGIRLDDHFTADIDGYIIPLGTGYTDFDAEII